MGFNEVQDLGFILDDIIGVCECALNFSDNANMTDYEKKYNFGSKPLSVANVLRFAQSLLPNSELELLTNIQKSIQEK